MNTDERLTSHVKQIAKSLSSGEYDFEAGEYDEPCAQDYLQDVLDIEYIIGGDGEFKGARVLVAYGGPNIWINTRTNIVEGYWWADKAFAEFEDTLGLNEWLEELYECTK